MNDRSAEEAEAGPRRRMTPRAPRRRPQPSRLVTALLLGALAATWAPTAAASGHSDHAEVEILLADPALGGASGAQARLDFHATSSRVVEVDTQGAYIAIRLPHASGQESAPAAFDVRFFAPADATGRGTYAQEQLDGNPHAVFRWDQGAPPAGTLVHNVTLEGTRTVGINQLTTIIWTQHGFNNLSTFISAPTTHNLVANIELQERFHDVPNGRRQWQQGTDAPDLTFILRATQTVAAPEFPTYQPNPASGWLIVVGIGAVSGGAWLLGKKLDGPKKATDEEETR